ncbi:sensor domain-containing diguanylate cyclase [Legionella sp. km772]|uniref:sensor domain-containing diguanylate cyclase n=1 Tax=Legionella sp. km772 TaxID=2498111 RepID=UPI000F8CE912|nr:sensor domain-containing diguanylate cyclase [Legionella sp. km772]RUR07309.1 GGDEF domain-containing protein [Legionella sp. km772]
MEAKVPVYNLDLLEQVINTQNLLASAHFDLQDFMELVTHKIQELTLATGAVIELVEDESMVYQAVAGSVSLYRGLKLPRAHSISGLCLRQNKILIARDTENDPRVNLEACRKVAARSLVVAPLVYSDKAAGVIKIVSKYPDAFNELHVKILELMAGFIASGLKTQLLFEEKANTIKKLKSTQARLDRMTKHDFLTKLPNRKFFDTVLLHAMDKVKRSTGLIALMFLDIDHFKWINDNLGHPVGDKLLVKFASFLKKNVRKYDFVVRLGGDEFVILFDDLSAKEDAISIAEKIINKLSRTVLLENHPHAISTSIGIALYRGESLSPASLVKQADDALYQVKLAGRKGFKVYGDVD